jgi:hypothetical protein
MKHVRLASLVPAFAFATLLLSQASTVAASPPSPEAAILTSTTVSATNARFSSSLQRPPRLKFAVGTQLSSDRAPWIWGGSQAGLEAGLDFAWPWLLYLRRTERGRESWKKHFFTRHGAPDLSEFVKIFYIIYRRTFFTDEERWGSV